MPIAHNGLWIIPYVCVCILRNHDTLRNNSCGKIVSKCPSLCFLHLAARSMAESGPQESWKAQLSMDFVEVVGLIKEE